MSTLMRSSQNDLLRVIQSEKAIKYACVLDEQGNKILSFNEDYLDLGEKEKRKLFMETVLQAKMMQEFNEDLGESRCNVVERSDGLKYVSSPLRSKNTALSIMDKNHDHGFFVNNITAVATQQSLEK